MVTKSIQKFQERIKHTLRIVLIIFAIVLFLYGGIDSILNATKATLTCSIKLKQCSLVKSKLLKTNKIEFSLSDLKGAYLKPYGNIILRTQPEHEFLSSIYAPQAPYGKDILNQGIVNEINQFVKNPQRDLMIRVSNRLFKYSVGSLLLLVVFTVFFFILVTILPKKKKSSFFMPLIGIMQSIIIFLSGFLMLIAIRYNIEFNCAAKECKLSAWRLDGSTDIFLNSQQLQRVKMNQFTYDEQILYEVVLITELGNFSLLSNANIISATSLVNNVNRFIDNPQENKVNFRKDNLLLTIFVLGLCLFSTLITLWIFSKSR